MKQILYIVFLLISFAFSPERTYGQNLPVVCGGSKDRYGITGDLGSNYDWEIEGGTINKNYNDSVDVTWDNTPGIHQLTVTEHTIRNCVAIPRTQLVVVSIPPKPDLGDTLNICQGQNITLSPTSGYKSYLWNTGSTSNSISTSGQGLYTLQATDTAGCVVNDSVYVAVNSVPHISLGNDTTLCGDITSITLDPGNDFANYQWSTGSNLPTLDATLPGTYWVKVTNDKGCIGSDTVVVSLCHLTTNIKIPNAFTPNNDGTNDTWQIVDLENYPNASVEVYDRWGRLVFQAKNGFPSEGWDGTSQGRNLPMDSYFYFIKLNDGSTQTYKGTVTIIR